MKDEQQPASLKKSRSRSRSGDARWKRYEPRLGVFVGPTRICGKSSPYDALYVAPKSPKIPKPAPKKRGLVSHSSGSPKGKQLRIDRYAAAT